jgi:hypothetical protein
LVKNATRDRTVFRVLVIVHCLALCGSVAVAQNPTTNDPPADDESELAKTIQNPLANLVSLPLQFNFNDGVDTGPVAGVDLPGGRRFFNLNVQPVNLLIGYYENVQHPDGGSMLRESPRPTPGRHVGTRHASRRATPMPDSATRQFKPCVLTSCVGMPGPRADSASRPTTIASITSLASTDKQRPHPQQNRTPPPVARCLYS